MSQQPLFLESFGEAVLELARCYPGQPKPGGGEFIRGPKGFAERLQPNKKPADAQRWLSDCCNPDREDRKFSDEEREQILRIGREIGCHVVKHYLDDATGYKRSEPIDPVDEKERLQRAFISAVEYLDKIRADMTRVDALAAHQAVSK